MLSISICPDCVTSTGICLFLYGEVSVWFALSNVCVYTNWLRGHTYWSSSGSVHVIHCSQTYMDLSVKPLNLNKCVLFEYHYKDLAGLFIKCAVLYNTSSVGSDSWYIIHPTELLNSLSLSSYHESLLIYACKQSTKLSVASSASFSCFTSQIFGVCPFVYDLINVILLLNLSN